MPSFPRFSCRAELERHMARANAKDCGGHCRSATRRPPEWHRLRTNSASRAFFPVRSRCVVRGDRTSTTNVNLPTCSNRVGRCPPHFDKHRCQSMDRHGAIAKSFVPRGKTEPPQSHPPDQPSPFSLSEYLPVAPPVLPVALDVFVLTEGGRLTFTFRYAHSCRSHCMSRSTRRLACVSYAHVSSPGQ